MRTIQTKATVTPDGKMVIAAPGGIAPGEHSVVVVIDEKVEMGKSKNFADFPVANYGGIFGTMTFRREEIYEDDCR